MMKIRKAYPDKTIWIYSGYTFEQLTDPTSKCHVKDITINMLKLADILIDGEFINDLKDLTLPFRGSSNQRVIKIKETFETNNIVLSEYMTRH